MKISKGWIDRGVWNMTTVGERTRKYRFNNKDPRSIFGKGAWTDGGVSTEDGNPRATQNSTRYTRRTSHAYNATSIAHTIRLRSKTERNEEKKKNGITLRRRRRRPTHTLTVHDDDDDDAPTVGKHERNSEQRENRSF